MWENGSMAVRICTERCGRMAGAHPSGERRKMVIDIRRMTDEDLDDVFLMEQLSFPDPWTRGMLEDWLHAPGYIMLCAVHEGHPVGYAAAYRTVDEINIGSLAVFPVWRKRGIGKALLDELDRTALGLGLGGITLEVRASNEAAIALYRKCGYEQRGRRKNYYDSPREDALIMWKFFDEL